MQTSVCVHVCLCVHFICILFVYLSALVFAGVECFRKGVPVRKGDVPVATTTGGG